MDDFYFTHLFDKIFTQITLFNINNIPWKMYFIIPILQTSETQSKKLAQVHTASKQ